MKKVVLMCVVFLSIYSEVMIGQDQTQKKQKINKNKMLNLSGSDERDSLTYEESLAKWELLKSENGNSYIYQQTFTSWTRFGCKTQIVVENGEVTARIYESWKGDGKRKKKLLSYVEKGDKIGLHDEGEAAITMDSLYAAAYNDLQVDKTQNTVIFTTFENGLLHTCGHIPEGCMDDCFTGKEIYALVWLNEKKKK